MVTILLTITAVVVIIGATVIALMNDKRDRAKERERQKAFEDGCWEYWRRRDYVRVLPSERRCTFHSAAE